MDKKLRVEKRGKKGAISHEMQVLRWQSRPSMMKRLLALLVGVAMCLFLVTFYNTIESSYVDLMDSIMESEGPSVNGVDIAIPLLPCQDGSGWAEEWIASGVMPRCSLAHQSKIDILYTYSFLSIVFDDRWVNGSEEMYQHEKTYWQDRSPVFGGSGKAHDRKVASTDRRHREHDELRYSVRSVFKYFSRGFSQIRILASDFYNGTAWVGQVPSWLDMDVAHRHGMSMLYTSELYGDDRVNLPVFSSLALESRFYDLSSTNDIMLYLNDDMFLASEHTVSDFWNPLTGIDINLDRTIFVQNQDASVADFQTDWNSEWTSLRYSNHLLSTLISIPY